MHTDVVQSEFIQRFTTLANVVASKHITNSESRQISGTSHYELLKNMKNDMPKIALELDNLATVIATELQIVATDNKIKKVVFRVLQQIAVYEFK